MPQRLLTMERHEPVRAVRNRLGHSSRYAYRASGWLDDRCVDLPAHSYEVCESPSLTKLIRLRTLRVKEETWSGLSVLVPSFSENRHASRRYRSTADPQWREASEERRTP